MRKLILAPMALACLIGSAVAQQAPTSTADQGKPGAAPWPVSWTGQSVLADLRVAGAPVASGNPVPVTVSNFPTTQTVAGSVTANIGTTNGLGLDTSLQTIRTTLGSPFQAGGSIGNTAFGISGTLPAFAAPPTVNLGTLNGAATAAGQNSTAAGTSATNAQGIQGVTGGVPVPVNGTLTANLGTLNGAALASNQSLILAQLTAANQRSAYYVDFGPGSLAANTAANNNAYDAGPQPTQYTKFNASYSATQSITAIIEGSYDASTFFTVYSGTVPAPVSPSTYGGLTASVPVTYRYYRTRIVGNATNSATVLVAHSFSTN